MGLDGKQQIQGEEDGPKQEPRETHAVGGVQHARDLRDAEQQGATDLDREQAVRDPALTERHQFCAVVTAAASPFRQSLWRHGADASAAVAD